MDNIAKKCIRCGNFYMFKECDFWISIKTSEGRYKNVYIAEPDAVAICPDCQKSFSKWWASTQNQLANIQTIELERPKGAWARTGQSFVNPNKFISFCCSNCLCDLDEHIRVEPNFCPNCGADMRNSTKETTFDDYLKEQLNDPEFRKEWEKLCEDEQKGGKE